MKSRQPETQLRDAIRDAVNATGLAWVSVNARGRRGRVPLGLMPSGSADLVGLLASGHFLALEIKMPRGKRSPAQVEWAEKVRKYGGVVYVVTSIPEAMEALKSAIRVVTLRSEGFTIAALHALPARTKL